MPYEGDALQDGFVFEIEAPDDTLIQSIEISIREPGSESGVLYNEYLTYNEDKQSIYS